MKNEIEKCDCIKCEKANSTCIHFDAYRRLPKSKGGLGLCPKLKNNTKSK